MGRASFTGGNVFAQNLQSGSGVKLLGGTGSDSTSVTFAKRMENIPKIVLTMTDSDAVTRYYVSNKSKTGFTANFVSSSLTSEISFDWHAYDDSYY